MEKSSENVSEPFVTKKREKDAISGQKGIVFSLESFVRYVK